ncbi:MAG: hypothetical protein DRQ47_00445 [Gammaproteobacteria bacterium]|nr:MAG: hypothetical protein DRQ47_00445 [Gammaproteobacteria bacterium]
MDNDFFQSLIAELSEAERPIFEQLLAKVKSLDGNIENLSADDQAQLAELVARHNQSSAPNIHQQVMDDEFSAAVTSDVDTAKISKVTDIQRPSETEFGAYLLDCVNQSLCHGGASTADAIRYAFHNRWMPETLKNRDLCEELYYRYQDDIEQANQNINQHASSEANQDPIVAVGLAWFTNLYLCYQLVEAEGEI